MIFIADIHGGRSNDSIMTPIGPSQTQDIITRLDYVLSETLMRRQDLIVVGGDVFNRVNPKSEDISVFLSWLSKCKAAGIEVFIIPGNHDAGVSWLSTVMFESADFDNVTVFNAAEEVEIADGIHTARVLFWPHVVLADREIIEDGGKSVSEFIAAMFPSAELIVTHGQVSQSDYVNDIFFEAGDAMIIDQKQFKKVKRILAGHIHDHSVFGKVVYPGSLTINNFGEVDEKKGFIDLDLHSGEYEWVEFPDSVTPWVHVELDLTDKDETALNEVEIEKLVARAVVKITVLAESHGTINESAIRAMFNKYGKVTRFETKVQGAEAITVKRKKESYSVLLKRYVDDEVDAKESDKKLALSLGRKIITEVTA